MTTIYYLIGLIFLFEELIWIMDPVHQVKSSLNWLRYHKKEKNYKNWNSHSEEYKSLLLKHSSKLISFIWLLMGLFTFQWVLFLSIILFNVIIISPISKRYLKNINIKGYTKLHWFNSLIGLLFVLFIIINKFHLHIQIL